MTVKFTPVQKRKIAERLAELRARNLEVPEDLREFLLGTKQVIHWPLTEYGCFTSRDGRKFNPNAPQKGFIFSEARFSALISGRGAGKTASGAQKALRKLKGGASGAVLNPDF
jgi:hypothetical protein